ncbi:hypothetical protein AAG570_010145 [Ranatra chinensis]|uniref:Uncharacterized protein n=1 Tax=Ranatra chinensis TaxID=642074 RepID=A0ABD0Z7V6_9HEMI
MASKRRNMFYPNKKQETAEIDTWRPRVETLKVFRRKSDRGQWSLRGVRWSEGPGVFGGADDFEIEDSASFAKYRRYALKSGIGSRVGGNGGWLTLLLRNMPLGPMTLWDGITRLGPLATPTDGLQECGAYEVEAVVEEVDTEEEADTEDPAR